MELKKVESKEAEKLRNSDENISYWDYEVTTLLKLMLKKQDEIIDRINGAKECKVCGHLLPENYFNNGSDKCYMCDTDGLSEIL